MAKSKRPQKSRCDDKLPSQSTDANDAKRVSIPMSSIKVTDNTDNMIPDAYHPSDSYPSPNISSPIASTSTTEPSVSSGLLHNGRSSDSVHNHGLASVSPSHQPTFTGPFHPRHNDDICDHIFKVGFHTGQFSDVTLQIFGLTFSQTYRLHRLILARSPMLCGLLSDVPGAEVVLNVNDKMITDISMGICLGYLYASWNDSLVTPENGCNVLATAWFLGIDDMCQLATNIICTKAINQLSVHQLVKFVEYAETMSPSNGDVPNGNVNNDIGYGPHTAFIKLQLQEYITSRLPREVNAFGAQNNGSHSGPSFSPGFSMQQEQSIGYSRLADIYTLLPFSYFKSSVESQAFPVMSEMQRFHFAKDVVAKREQLKRQQATSQSSSKGESALDIGEESVVLAFGGGPNSVTIVRKPAKGVKGKFWKTPRDAFGSEA